MECKHKSQMNSDTHKQVIFFLMFKVISQVFGESAGLPTKSQNDNETNLKRIPNTDIPTTTSDYYNYEYDLAVIFQINSDYCKDKSVCSEMMFLTFPDRLCHCDKLCGIMNDCCGNYNYKSPPLLTKDLFECLPLYEIVKNRDYGLTMVAKCSPDWNHNITKALCETKTEADDILLRLPVSDKTEFHVMFKNMYCAQCNFVSKFYYWKQEIKCRNETGVRSLPEMDDCELFFIRPQPEISQRTCQISQTIISSCAQPEAVIGNELVHNCTDGIYSITYDDSGIMYRNKYCAVCNGVVEDSMFCEQIFEISFMPTIASVPRGAYSLRLIVDINTGTVSRNENDEKVKQCNEDEIYDGLSQKCRKIFCAPPLKAINGFCNGTFTNVSVSLEQEFNLSFHPENCTMTKLDPSEYEFTNSSDLLIFSNQKVYSTEKFLRNGSDVFICVDELQSCSHDCSDDDNVNLSDVVESYLTLVGLVVSIVSLAITLVVYMSFPQLLNTPGKILVSLIISLLFAQILFVSSVEFEHIPKLCTAVAILVHYFFLAAFCWMNVIAFDLWMTFSNSFTNPSSDSKGRKRFVLYSLYAWLIPFSIVCVAVFLEFIGSDVDFDNLKPKYGQRVCWISSRDALILFFAGPLALFKIFDIISFILTAVHIARMKKETAMARKKKNTCSFIITLKLSFIMGLTWLFAFIANATNETSLWYLFIIFNSLQGLFIALCFLCSKKVSRLISYKYEQVTAGKASVTQSTSLP